mgnify:FL=1
MVKDVPTRDYQFGFHDDVESIYDTGKGLNEDIVREISARKNEPEWMLDYRLKAYKHYKDRPVPTWGADLSGVDFDNYTCLLYTSPSPRD